MSTPPARDTRTLILERAEELFAERGFYGTSIAAIVSELGLTKQALLHYFSTKEKLYGEVLGNIAQAFLELEEGKANYESDPVARVTLYFESLFEWTLTRQNKTIVLMRELLDNRPRAENVEVWYLSSFLERIIAMVKAVPGWEHSSDAQALGVAYTWIGAINYFAISEPTLTGIFGARQVEEFSQGYPAQLKSLIAASLAAGVPD